MWKYDCPKAPKVIYEFHSEERARIFLAIHLAGMRELGIKPCEEIHNIVDDGEPCGVPNCRFTYYKDGM